MKHERGALQYLVGGVNSPVRSFRAVGGKPLLIQSGMGAVVVDDRGKEYVDFICSWGAMLLGHGAPMRGAFGIAQGKTGVWLWCHPSSRN